MNWKLVAVELSSFSILTFKKNGALLSPLLDPHVRARAELALSLEKTIRDTAVADASTRFLARRALPRQHRQHPRSVRDVGFVRLGKLQRRLLESGHSRHHN